MTDPKVTDKHRACAEKINELMTQIFYGEHHVKKHIPEVLADFFPAQEPEEWMEKAAREIGEKYGTSFDWPLTMRIIAAHAPDIRESELYRAAKELYEAADSDEYNAAAQDLKRVLAKLDAEGKSSRRRNPHLPSFEDVRGILANKNVDEEPTHCPQCGRKFGDHEARYHTNWGTVCSDCSFHPPEGKDE